MKKLSTLLFILMIIKIGFAQIELDSAKNIYDVIDVYKNAYDTSILNAEGGIGKDIRNMEMIWAPRLFPSGDSRDAANAIYNYVTNYTDNQTIYSPNWSCLGPIGLPDKGTPTENLRGNGQMGRITFAPNYDDSLCKTIYACTSFGGLWRTINNGDYWENVNTDLLPFAGVADMCINPADTNQLFLCTGYADGATARTYDPNWGRINPLFTHGLFRSDDYGATWQPINNDFLEDFVNGGTCRRMVVNPLHPDTIFIATTQGIYRTENATATDPEDVEWENVFTGPVENWDHEFRGLAFHPNNPNIVYSSGTDIYKSIDGGDAWYSITGPTTGLDLENMPNDFQLNRINITVTPASGAANYIYAYIEGSEFVYEINVWKWKDCMYLFVFDGSNWNQIEYRNNSTGGLSSGWMGIAVSPVNQYEVYYSTTTVYGTEDYRQLTPPSTNPNRFPNRSVYWSTGESNTGFHPDVHDLKFQPSGSFPDIYAATDGGISVKNLPNTGLGNWEYKYNGLQAATVWAFDDSDWDKDQFIIGNQDCGTYVISENIDNWEHIYGGDGYGSRINDGNNNVAFLSLGEAVFKGYDFQSELIKSDENNLRPIDPWDNVGSTPMRTRVPRIMPLFNNPLTNTMYFGFTEIWKRNFDWPTSSDWTDLWEIDSDIRNAHNPVLGGWQRQITELVICESDTNTIYVVTGGQQNEPTVWQLESHLFKSTTGGINGSIPGTPNFTDLSFPGGGTIELNFPIITGIVVDPLNKDRIWICYTGYVEDYKVWYTDDGGDDLENWENFDPNGTLYNLPVNAIAYQYGSPDRLYIGTDAGVYTRDANSLDWEKFGDFPNVRVTELKINYCANKLRVATFGRGVWEGDLVNYETQYVKEIDSTITLYNDLALQGSLQVNEGATLTVKKTINIPKNQKIVIQPGGKLILDGGILTNSCGDQWQGIEVWGDPLLSQTPSNQGMIEIINGGTIENAVLAVRLGSKDYTNKGGGIIFATEAVFRNNNTGVKFETYSSDNSSYFDRCTFETTAGLPDNQVPQYFVMMTSVDGIDIKGCTFENSLSDEVLYSDRGIGIYSVNSVFTVDKVCISGTTPCTLYQYPEFNNLNYAIKALATSSNTPCYIREGQFTDNRRGVYLSGISSATFTNNIIHMSLEQFGSVTNDTIYGSYFDACTGYTFHENQFISDYDQYNSKIALGLVINNSGPDNNLVYDNIFENVFTSTLIQGENRNSGGSTGLVIKCNQFLNTLYDEVITFPGLFSSAYMGIALHQGANTLNNPDMAGNLFYYNAISKDYDDLNNKANLFYYYYPTNTYVNYLEPLDFTKNKVTKVGITISTSWTRENGCPAATNPGGGESESLLMQINEAGQQVDSIQNILSMLIDSGDTESLQDDVETSTPSSSMQVYNELMSTSPYLSDTVVSTAIEKEDVLPNAMLRDVMVANPNSAKSDELLSKLDSRWDPMPDYMKAQILQGRSIVSLREETEANLSAYRLKKSIAFYQLINYYLAQPDLDSLALLFSSDNTMSSKYRLAFLYLSKGEFEAGTTVLNAIPSQFQLTSEDLMSHEAIVDYYDLLAANPQGIITPDSTQLAQIRNISTTGTGNASVYARNVLLAMDQITYNEPILLPDLYKSSEAVETYEKMLNTGQPPSLRVYPNPSKDYVIVEFVTEITKNSLLVINDSYGQLIKSVQLNSCRDQLVLDTRGWSPGIYVVSLQSDDKTTESCKFSIVR